jgi:hypothetical protein
VNRKKLKLTLITFVVLGITGLAILKGKYLFDRVGDARRKKKGLMKTTKPYDRFFSLPDEFQS